MGIRRVYLYVAQHVGPETGVHCINISHGRYVWSFPCWTAAHAANRGRYRLYTPQRCRRGHCEYLCTHFVQSAADRSTDRRSASPFSFVPQSCLTVSSRSGIGLAAAKTFAAKGMKVFLADIDAALLQNSRKQVEAVASAGEVESMVVDVSKLEDVVALKDKVMELWGEVAILMNNVSPNEVFSTPNADTLVDRQHDSNLRPHSPLPNRPNKSLRIGIKSWTSTTAVSCTERLSLRPSCTSSHPPHPTAADRVHRGAGQTRRIRAVSSTPDRNKASPRRPGTRCTMCPNRRSRR